jgi:hypothetical protein
LASALPCVSLSGSLESKAVKLNESHREGIEQLCRFVLGVCVQDVCFPVEGKGVNIHLDNDVDLNYDKLAKLAELFETRNINIRNNYFCGSEVTPGSYDFWIEVRW